MGLLYWSKAGGLSRDLGLGLVVIVMEMIAIVVYQVQSEGLSLSFEGLLLFSG